MPKKLVLIETESGLKEIKYWISDAKDIALVEGYSGYNKELAKATLQVHLMDLKLNTTVG